MAVETLVSIYWNWFLMVGNGLFKPNMTSIISYMLMKSIQKKKDGAYSLYYMGLMQGPLGIMFVVTLVRKYLGAGVLTGGYFYGMLQFYFTQNIFEKLV
jgi:POT family proton-dependent oligopeptide transporter